tara:strand:+ start:19177 stop:20949 length:1773 start_codon:yes stop_codon:yes gene_type:complete
MNKDELNFVVERYFSPGISLDSLFEAVGHALDSNLQKSLLLEQMDGASMTLAAIPDISVTELGWTDVRTVGNQEIDGPARTQLLQFLANIPGADLKQKLQSISDFYDDPDAAGLDSPNLGDRIANVLSYLVFYKTLTKVISNFNAASAGFNFEAFLAVLLEGQQIAANTGTIADFITKDNTPVSLKLYSEKSVVVGGSFSDLVGDLTEPKFGHDFMQYIVVMKSFEDEKQGLDVKGDLKFFKFNFTLENVVDIVARSMDKSVKCIEIPNEFIRRIRGGETDYDFSETLPAQENLSTEVLESKFIEEFKEIVNNPMVRYGKRVDLDLSEEQISQFFTGPCDWANNDKLFKPVKLGEDRRVARGRSPIQIGNPDLHAAVETMFGEIGYDDLQKWAIKKAVSSATDAVNTEYSAKTLRSQRAEMLSGGGVFADPRTSAEFYNSLTDPEIKKRALLNMRGRLSNLQFDLNRGQVYNISENIGEIKIGAVYVQAMLDKITADLNESIFSLFQSVKAIQEGTYAFMAGGLKDDAEASKAIKASNDVAAKTSALAPGAGEAAAPATAPQAQSPSPAPVNYGRVGQGKKFKPFTFPEE